MASSSVLLWGMAEALAPERLFEAIGGFGLEFDEVACVDEGFE